MLQNPFHVIRYICFAIILFLDLLTLIFAGWNIALTKASGGAAPGASVLLLFNCCALFLSIATALVELVVVKVKTAKVKFECSWTALMAILQLTAAMLITTNGPPLLCRRPNAVAACTSVTVLVPITWLSTFTIVVYFLTLTITTIVYAPGNPDIWSLSVYEVPWFVSGDDGPSLSRKPSGASSTLRSIERSNHLWDDYKVEEHGERPTSRSCLSIVMAPWAKPFQNKRGRDRPFATRSQVVAANPDIPAPLPKSYPPPIAARYLELSHPFPSEVENEDKPVPHNTLSQWVRADIANGRNVHTRPLISPC